jgi:hypothetical protein
MRAAGAHWRPASLAALRWSAASERCAGCAAMQDMFAWLHAGTCTHSCACCSQLPIARVRYVAVSATIPNVHDIAQWLRAPAAGLLVFGEDMRPVRLVTHVRGYAQTSNDFLFERRLNDYLPGIVTEFSRGKPTLIFCRCAPLHGAHQGCAFGAACLPS